MDSTYSSNRGELLPLGSFGHTGFTGTSLWIDPLTKSWVVFLSNRVHPDGKGDVTPLRARVATIVGSAIVNFSIQMVILVGATVVAGQFPVGSRWLYFPLALLVLIVFATALALLLSAVNVYLRDVQYLVEVALLIFFWASPIVYSWKLVTGALEEAGLGGSWVEELYLANPVTLVILAFQRTFWVAGDGQPVPPDLGARLGVARAVGLVFLWLCQRVFARLQSNFAQEL
jgi:ABC-2 type transport system permease protein